MPKPSKCIVKAGSYLIKDADGKEKIINISRQRLRDWARKANLMGSKGLTIPAPIGHNEKSLPVVIGNDGVLPKVKDNAGYWSNFSVKKVKDTYGLYANFEGDETAVSKAKETSIYVRPEYKDGLGRNWKDALMHVALVTHPVEPDQEPFEGLALSMSHMMQTDVTSLIDMLKKAAKIALPEGTTMEELPDKLMVALKQKLLSEKNDESDESVLTPPSGSGEAGRPVLAMSETPKKEEKQEVTDDIIMAHPLYKQQVAAAKQQAELTKGLLAQAKSAAKTAFTKRISRLISKGVVSDDYAKEHLNPLVDTYDLSFNNEGNAIVSPIETTLSALENVKLPEAQGALAMSQQVGGEKDLKRLLALHFGGNIGDYSEVGKDAVDDMTEDEMDAVANQIANA